MTTVRSIDPTRRDALLALAAVSLPAAAADGPARIRPGAAQGLVLDLTAAGQRLVAVGERGHVLLSDDQGKAWRQARAVPTRSTLTALHATSATELWAVGHGGVILQSTDAGETWRLADGKSDGPDVLLAVRVEPDGRGLAVGGFGSARATADGGRSWKALTLLDGEAGERHLNRLFVSAAGTWLVAAEGGHVLRSADQGPVQAMKWAAVKTPYAGSLWTGAALGGGLLLACGMRGNLVRSTDDGRSWTHQAIVGAGSFTALAPLADGRVALVGVDGTLVIGDTAAQAFQLHRQDDRATLTAAHALAGGGLLLASTAGLKAIKLPG